MKHVEALKYCCYYMQYEDRLDVNFHFFPISQSPEKSDSGEEPYELVGATISDPLDEYKKAVASIIEEYFSTGDVTVAASDWLK